MPSPARPDACLDGCSQVGKREEKGLSGSGFSLACKVKDKLVACCKADLPLALWGVFRLRTCSHQAFGRPLNMTVLKKESAASALQTLIPLPSNPSTSPREPVILSMDAQASIAKDPHNARELRFERSPHDQPHPSSFLRYHLSECPLLPVPT